MKLSVSMETSPCFKSESVSPVIRQSNSVSSIPIDDTVKRNLKKIQNSIKSDRPNMLHRKLQEIRNYYCFTCVPNFSSDDSTFIIPHTFLLFQIRMILNLKFQSSVTSDPFIDYCKILWQTLLNAIKYMQTVLVRSQDIFRNRRGNKLKKIQCVKT